LWLHSLKVAQLLRSAAYLHTNQSRSYLNHLVQGNIETGMDLWNIAMRMPFTIKYSKNPEIPVQNFKAYKKRTMVRYKSNSSPRTLHRERKKCV